MAVDYLIAPVCGSGCRNFDQHGNKATRKRVAFVVSGLGCMREVRR